MSKILDRVASVEYAPRDDGEPAHWWDSPRGGYGAMLKGVGRVPYLIGLPLITISKTIGRKWIAVPFRLLMDYEMQWRRLLAPAPSPSSFGPLWNLFYKPRGDRRKVRMRRWLCRTRHIDDNYKSNDYDFHKSPSEYLDGNAKGSKLSALAKSSYERVYYATLNDGRAIAIKKLDVSSEPQTGIEFLSQVAMVSKLKHDNLWSCLVNV